MFIQTNGKKLNSNLDGHYEDLFNEMVNFKRIEEEKVYECIKVDSLISMIEFLISLEDEVLVIKHKEVFNIGFDNMLKWFYTKQLGLEKVSDIPPKIDVYEIELIHFYLIMKYMGGYGIVTREGKWLDVIERMGLQVYMESMVELCYETYFSLLDCYYKTMMEEDVGTSKTKKEKVIWAVSKVASADPKTAVDVPKTSVGVLKPAVAALKAEMGSSKTAVEKEAANDGDSSEDDLIIITNEDAKDC
ncbi:hypothetical protein R6Q57_020424 [Mikania cordata]